MLFKLSPSAIFLYLSFTFCCNLFNSILFKIVSKNNIFQKQHKPQFKITTDFKKKHKQQFQKTTDFNKQECQNTTDFEIQQVSKTTDLKKQQI